MINDVTAFNQRTFYQNQKVPSNASNAKPSDQKTSFSGDTVSLNQRPAETGTYGINKTSGRVTSNFSDVRQMIVNVFKDQGLSTRIAAGDTSIDLNNITQAEAQDLISEDGYWGVKQTSNRIVEMAVSLAGNDPEKLSEIKASIENGFQMATKTFGGSLPDISMDTFDAVMEKLDSWAIKSASV